MRYFMVFVMLGLGCSAVVDEKSTEEEVDNVVSNSDLDADSDIDIDADSDVDSDSDSDIDSDSDSDTDSDSEAGKDTSTEGAEGAETDEETEIEEEVFCEEKVEGLYIVDDYNFLRLHDLESNKTALVGEINCEEDSEVVSISLSGDGFIYALVTKEDQCSGIYKVDRDTAECLEKTKFSCMSEFNTFSFTFVVSEDKKTESVYLSTGLTMDYGFSEIYKLSGNFEEFEHLKTIKSSVDFASTSGSLFAFGDRLDVLGWGIYKTALDIGTLTSEVLFGMAGNGAQLFTMYNGEFYVFIETSLSGLMRYDDLYEQLIPVTPFIFEVRDMTSSPC